MMDDLTTDVIVIKRHMMDDDHGCNCYKKTYDG